MKVPEFPHKVLLYSALAESFFILREKSAISHKENQDLLQLSKHIKQPNRSNIMDAFIKHPKN